ncbi:MAG: hypothetical protein HY329_13490 [Chloroflexi bacterium]|nr:hypothetical protein [Chloroflexota bacterium]
MSSRIVPIVALGLLMLVLVVGIFLLIRAAAPAPGRTGGPVATASPGTAAKSWYEVRFTTPKIPDDKSSHSGGLDARLVQLMDTATKTLDVAVYDFDLMNVAQAMARVSQRGVRVRMVTDTDTVKNERNEEIQAALKVVRDARIPIVEDSRSAIMHHKFTIVDDEWVQTGSWNYTDGDTYRLNNNQVILRSREVAASFTNEFEKMFSQRKFGPNKPKDGPSRQHTVEGTRVDTYFCAPDGCASRLIDEINKAQKSVHFLAFSFTHDGIGRAVIAKKQAGLRIGGVFEKTGSETRFSELANLQREGAEVYQDGSPYVMHHKVFILDEKVTAFGSFNFSDGADKDNDENLVIVDDPALAASFKAEYDRLVALAKNPPAR